MTERDLILPEEVLLLILDDDSGVRSGSYASYVCVGAAIAELALAGHISVVGEGKKQRLRLEEGAAITHPYLSSVLSSMRAKGFEKKPRDLVMHAGRRSSTLDPLHDQLVDLGILRRERKKVLGLFPVTRYPLVDRGREAAIKARLEMAMFNFGDITPRDASLIALAQYAGVLRKNFDKEKLKENKQRIKEITEGDHLGLAATKEALAAIQAAIMAATIAATAGATVT